ncbi:hypothetical protein Slin15195_G049870 [Septoria linicola]|uniref:Uncharacterized protein n=1 Tax=Septoria linicola TaxID=215465 RepID=A0A9Q9AR76_9PEZI|nr:hypothetical protein Slin15195_G049870 [Septoria linicola]
MSLPILLTTTPTHLQLQIDAQGTRDDGQRPKFVGAKIAKNNAHVQQKSLRRLLTSMPMLSQLGQQILPQSSRDDGK